MSAIERLVPHQSGQYDFGLSAKEEMRAAQLHGDSIVFDMLSQHAGGNIFAAYPEDLIADFRERFARAPTRLSGFAEAIYWPFEMFATGRSSLIFEWLHGAGLTCGTFDIDTVVDGQADPLAWDWDERMRRYCRLPGFRLITRAQEVRDAKREGAVGLFANYQPTTPVPRNLSCLDVAYAKGLRSLMLTYNRMDHIGVGCTERVDAGLSMFGVEVVGRCNELGIIVDTSHCGRQTTLDACRVSKRPVTANHTAARKLHDHARCKSDDELKAIAATGGVIGVVAVPSYLTYASSPSIEVMLDHIDYLVELVGWQHVAIGTDWPLQAPDDVLLATFGAEMRALGFRKTDALDLEKRLIGFDDCRDLPNITRGLVSREYADHEVRGILGENALRVFAEVCG